MHTLESLRDMLVPVIFSSSFSLLDALSLPVGLDLTKDCMVHDICRQNQLYQYWIPYTANSVEIVTTLPSTPD